MKIDDFENKILEIEQQHRFLDDFILPDYEKLNVVNLKSLIHKIFGISAKSKIPLSLIDESEDVENVILLLLDGLGAKRILNHMKSNKIFLELAEKGKINPITATFPSTTATCLTSIFTGLYPSEHGIIGYQMYSKEKGTVFNTLDMKPIQGYNRRTNIAEKFNQKIKPWIPDLDQNGIENTVITKDYIIGSGLSKTIHQNQKMTPYKLPTDMFVQCKRALEQQGRKFILAYYGGIDTLEHKYGPYSQEVIFEIQSIEYNIKNMLNNIPDKIKEKTLLLITADHGVSETTNTYYIKDYPNIDKNLIIPPVGDSRATFLFAKEQYKKKIRKTFEKKMPGFKLIESDELVKIGAFGPNKDQELYESTGDYTVLSINQNNLQYPYFEEDREKPMKGAHGGMTPEEMIVPLLTINLSKMK